MAILSTCIITGLPIQDYKEIPGGFEYSLTYNGKTFRLKFANTIDWAEVIAGDKKFLLTAMLYNNEWPFDLNAIITAPLIQKAASWANYPRLDDFEAQKAKYLEWCFYNGGERRLRIEFNAGKFLLAYMRNEEEMRGLYKTLKSDGYIEESEGGKLFELTDKGIEEAKKVIAKRPKKIKYTFPQNKYPRLYVCYVEADKEFAERFVRELEDYHLYQIVKQNGLRNDDNTGFSDVKIARQYIVKGEEDRTADYVVLIQSQNSDQSKSFGSIVDIAVEEHIKRGGLNGLPNFISIACIDDSQLRARPRYDDYHQHFNDIRLLSHKDYLINAISTDWLNKINMEAQNRQIVSKADCLEWIIQEYNQRRSNPMYLYYSQINYRLQSKELMEELLDELIKDEAISVEKYPQSFGEDKTGYKVTLTYKGLNLLEEWKQTGRKYNFPLIGELSDDEKIWLEAIYQKFLKAESPDVKALRYELNDKLSKEFEPFKGIDNRLASSASFITLYGIWHIHPESDIFEKVDKVIYAIQEIIGMNPGVNEVTSEMILDKVPEVSVEELNRIRDLLYQFNGKLINGHGIVQGKQGITKWTISTNDIYDTYRTYTGLYDLMASQYGFSQELPTGENISVPISGPAFQSKTKPILRVEKGIEVVLNVKEVAKEVGELINLMSSEKGMMVGVMGKWGRGKTIFLTELWKYLGNIKQGKENMFIKVEYPAWKYQHTPASWAYLYETLASKYCRKPEKWYQFIGYSAYWCRLLRLNFQRFGIWPLLKYAGSLALAGIVSFGLVKYHFYALIGIPFVSTAWLAFAKHVKQQYSTETQNLIKKYGLKHGYKPTMGLQAEIQSETIDLLKTWIPIKEKDGVEQHHKRIVLFVEDIDRCSEDRIMENIDALRVMLDDDEVAKRVVIVSAIDKEMLMRAIKAKYSKFVKPNAVNAQKRLKRITGEYMDKLFISAIRLGSLDANQRDDVFIAMVKDDMEDKNFTPFNELNKSESPLHNGVSKDMPITENPNKTEEPITPPPTPIQTPPIDTTSLQKHEEKKALSEFERLKPEELNLLRKCVAGWNGATPRRIRIFYYRYLIAKNLLISRYTSLGKDNIWQMSSTHTKYLAEQIIYYSKSYDAAKITNRKNKAITERSVANNYIDTPPVSAEDYIELMKVLEIVIAY